MKAISFLGMGNYQETTYVLGNSECQTKLFPVALCQFTRPSELLVLVTNSAKAKWLKELEEQVKDCALQLTPVDIPDGHSVDDLWEIFARLTERLAEKEEVIFDITHSFRTLPFLAFLAASYLRVAKQVDIKGVYYGAWEARVPLSREALPTDRAPVFDLSPFMKLLEWTTATDKFIKTGDGHELARVLRDTQSSLHRSAVGQSGVPLPRGLIKLAADMETLSLALALTRPREALPAAATLGQGLAAAESDVTRWAQPFAVLLDRTRQDYQPLALSHPDTELEANLRTQWRLIDWYLERQQILQAATLAREWTVSVLCWRLERDWLAQREVVENALNAHTRQQQGLEYKQSALQSEVAALPQASELASLWGNMTLLRNDLAHCGMKKGATSADKLLKNVLKLKAALHQCAANFGLIPSEEMPS
jgi:CRISPR-associated DxTHG motif protein